MLRKHLVGCGGPLDRPRERRPADDVPETERGKDSPEPHGEGGREERLQVRPLERHLAAEVPALSLTHLEDVLGTELREEREARGGLPAREQADIAESRGGRDRLRRLGL